MVSYELNKNQQYIKVNDHQHISIGKHDFVLKIKYGIEVYPIQDSHIITDLDQPTSQSEVPSF
jgi:hypothetical protein